MINRLKKTSILWFLFLATVFIFVGFRFWIPQLGGTILDSVATVEEASTLLSGMSAAQKNSHFMMTLLLDMIFPFAYGGLFIGLTLRFGGKFGLWLAIPAFLVIPVDLAENTIQLMALTGNDGLLPIKAVLTPLKFVLFPLGGLLALGVFVLAKLIRSADSRSD